MQLPHTPTPAPSRIDATSPTTARARGAVLRQFGLFLLLTYVLTWWVVPLGSDSFPVFPYGPDLALVVLVSLTGGRAGLRRLGRSLRKWRVHAGWYLFALLVPAAIGIGSVLAVRAAGAPASVLPGPDTGIEFLVVLPVMILVGGAFGEELGWRGFALPVLQRRFSPVGAVAIIVVAHAIWHLPLFFTSEPPAAPPFLIELAGGGIVLAWLMNSLRVIWVPILLHGAHNMAQQAFMSEVTGADLVTLQWFTAAGWAALALAVLIITRGRLAADGRAPLTTALDEEPSTAAEAPVR